MESRIQPGKAAQQFGVFDAGRVCSAGSPFAFLSICLCRSGGLSERQGVHFSLDSQGKANLPKNTRAEKKIGLSDRRTSRIMLSAAGIDFGWASL
jgi:hypothetical protein